MTPIVELIKQLRQESGAGVLDCRQALEQANGSYTEALSSLREKAAAEAARRAERKAGQGMIEMYSHRNGQIGVMVEVNTETDFSARSDTLRAFAHEIALQIAAAAPLYVGEEDIPAEVIEQEAQKAASKARGEGKPETLIPRIVEGSLKKYKEKHLLLRQAYIRDDQLTVAALLSQTAAKLGEKVVISRFARWEIISETA